MTCAATTQDAPVSAASAGRLHLTIPARNARSVPAATTANGRKRGGKKNTMPDLTARAIRLCNRNKEATARYLAVHAILFRGREVGR